MPELPEVEHISRWLHPQFVGQTLEGVVVHEGGQRQLPQGEAVVRERIRDRKVLGIGRRGKVILMELDGGDTLAIHLKMTGQLWPAAPSSQRAGAEGAASPTHVRLSLLFHQYGALQFVDVRRFGWLQVWTPRERASWESKLGPEPLPSLPTGWAEALRGQRAIKSVLLDQRLIAGIGNIYADEILFRAALHPRRPVGSLSPGERQRLRGAIEQEMQAAVDEREGIPDQKRVGGGDRSVKALFDWRVFQRGGEACFTCHEMIAYETVAQRGTYFCPRCQPVNGHPMNS